MSAKPYRCAKCQSYNIFLDEHCVTHLIHSPNDPEGTQEPGEIFKVVLGCRDCGHETTQRGIVCAGEAEMERLEATRAASVEVGK